MVWWRVPQDGVSCERGIEPSGAIKGKEFLDLLLSKKALRLTELLAKFNNQQE